MFEKFAVTKSTSTSTSSTVELTRTTEFLQCVVDKGYRLSYGALAAAAKILGENTSGQSPAQRGSALVKQLPEALQPFVCRHKGNYAKGADSKWHDGAPEMAELLKLPVIQRTVDTKDWAANEIVAGAVEIWEESLKAE